MNLLIAVSAQQPAGLWESDGDFGKYIFHCHILAMSGTGSFHFMLFFLGLKKIAIIAIAIGFAILIVISGTVIACKLRENSYHKHPSTILLHNQQGVPSKGPLPAVPEGHNTHYRSLIRQPDSQAFPHHSQTMPRPQQGEQYGDNCDYNYDWKFGTAPWQRSENQGTVRV